MEKPVKNTNSPNPHSEEEIVNIDSSSDSKTSSQENSQPRTPTKETNHSVQDMEEYYRESVGVVSDLDSIEEEAPETNKNKIYFTNDFSDFSKQKRVRGFIVKKKEVNKDDDETAHFFKRVNAKTGEIEKTYPLKKINLFQFLKYRFGFFPIFVFFAFTLLFMYAYPVPAIATQVFLFLVVKLTSPFKNKKNLKRSILFMKAIIVSGLIVSTIYLFASNNSAFKILTLSQSLFLSSVSYFMTFYAYSFYFRFYSIYKIKQGNDDSELNDDSFFLWRGFHQ